MMSKSPFATNRTRQWRQSGLRDFNKSEIDTIERFGFQILGVGAGHSGLPGFAYTFGLFDTAGLPEMITVGLPHETAFALLNEAAGRLRIGIDLSKGRHAGLLSDVECEFRVVDPKWVSRLMLGATWFYAESEFPVLQAVYPDLENRFPEDPVFDPDFWQPRLQPGLHLNSREQEFWLAHEQQ